MPICSVIEVFLKEAEVPACAFSLKISPTSEIVVQNEISFEDARFEGDISPKGTLSRFQLGPLNLRFPQGKLTLVSWATRSGKNAL